MTTVAERPAPTVPPAGRPWWHNRWVRYGIYAFSLFLALSVTQEFAKLPTEDLTSSGTWAIALGWSVPILLAGMGGIFSERSGIVNIGLEGMLILGTWCGAYGTILWNPWAGLAFAAVGGAIGGLVLAVAAVTYGVDHIVAGVAINLMAPGVARFLSDQLFTSRGGSITQSPPITGVGSLNVPFLAGGKIFGWKSPDMLGSIEDWDVFFISDVGGILRGMVSNMSWFTLIAYLLVPFSIWLLWRTAFGLRLRSCGEHPIAADSLGVNVYKYKYYGVVIGGALAGLGGGFLSVQLSGLYKEGQTLGKGFIGLATMIFGNWRPVGTALGALLFGFTETLRLRDPNAAHGLLLLVTIGLAVVVVRKLYLRQMQGLIYVILAGIGMAIWYFTTDSVPNQLPRITPNIAVLVVMLFATQRLRMPAADGQPYRKGDT